MEGAPSARPTPPILIELAGAALSVLKEHGRPELAATREHVWTYLGTNKDGLRFEIRCTGPDLPATIPEMLISPSEIPKNPNWRGQYRLVVSPPNIALDLCWTPGEPLRIMTFSRGDWESELTARAAQ